MFTFRITRYALHPTHATLDAEAFGPESQKSNRSEIMIVARVFETSTNEKLDGQMHNGTFIPVNRIKIPAGSSGLASHFIDQLKNTKHGIGRNCHLVAHNYSDIQYTKIGRKAPTVYSLSQRLIFSRATSINGWRHSHVILLKIPYKERPRLNAMFICVRCGKCISPRTPDLRW